MTYQFLKLEQTGEIATITLNRPEKSNALNSALRTEITAALQELRTANTVKAIILTGAGERAFCAGQDLEEARQFDADKAAAWMDESVTMFEALHQLEKPLVAAVNGVAAGAGFQLALLCDLRIGYAGSRMGQPEINAGIPSILGSSLMWDTLGASRTIELSLTGRLMDSEESYRLGLLHYLVPTEQVQAKTLELARELAAKPPLALRLTKRHLRSLSQPTIDTLRQAGKSYQREAFATGEPQAVISGLLARRKSSK